MWKAKITGMHNLTACDLGILTINETFYKISFSSQTLVTVIFCFPLIPMKGTASNICKKKVRFLDFGDILFHFLGSGPLYTAQFYSP